MLRVLVIILLILLYFTLFDEASLIFLGCSGLFLKSKDGIVGTRPAVCMSQLRVVTIMQIGILQIVQVLQAT